MPSKHAAIGGSTIKRAMRCPASVKLVAELPKDDRPKPAADRGSMLHEAIGIMAEENCSAESLIGYEAFGQRLTREDARKALLPAHAALARFAASTPIALEVYVRFKIHKDVGGTADILGHDKRVALVGDFKFGERIIEVKNNEQLLFYAAGALDSGAIPKNTTHVQLGIIQPANRKVLTQQRVKLDAVKRFRDVVHKTVDAALLKRDPKFSAGEHCEFCRARQTCPELVGSRPRSLADALTKLQWRS